MKNLIVISILFLSSCASHFGTISSTSIGKNVVYEDIAYGVSKSTNILGIGGLQKDALVLQAKMNLIKNRPLKANEEYANFTVDFKNSYLGFYFSKKVTMTADVIRHSDKLVSEIYSPTYKQKIYASDFKNNFFSVGDSVINVNLDHGHIISLEKNDNIRVAFLNLDGNIQTKKYKSKNLYSKTKNSNVIKVGDSVSFYSVDRIVQLGIVKAIGINEIIVLDMKNNLNIVQNGSFESNKL